MTCRKLEVNKDMILIASTFKILEWVYVAQNGVQWIVSKEVKLWKLTVAYTCMFWLSISMSDAGP